MIKQVIHSVGKTASQVQKVQKVPRCTNKWIHPKAQEIHFAARTEKGLHDQPFEMSKILHLYDFRRTKFVPKKCVNPKSKILNPKKIRI